MPANIFEGDDMWLVPLVHKAAFRQSIADNQSQKRTRKKSPKKSKSKVSKRLDTVEGAPPPDRVKAELRTQSS